MTWFSARRVAIGMLLGSVWTLTVPAAHAELLKLKFRSLDNKGLDADGAALKSVQVRIFLVGQVPNTVSQTRVSITSEFGTVASPLSISIDPGKGSGSNGFYNSNDEGDLWINLGVSPDSSSKTIAIVANRLDTGGNPLPATAAFTYLVLDGFKEKDLTIAVPGPIYATYQQFTETQPPICYPSSTQCYVPRRACCFGGLFRRRCQ